MNTEKLLMKYCSGIPKERFSSLLRHNRDVLNIVEDILNIHPEINIDIDFLKQAIDLHDIGTCVLSDNDPYITHGVLGRKILEKEGYKKHALVCERHVGSGISKDEIAKNKLPLPNRDMLPRTLEEKLICYADKFSSKSKVGKHSVDEIKREMKSYGGNQLARFMDLDKIFHN